MTSLPTLDSAHSGLHPAPENKEKQKRKQLGKTAMKAITKENKIK